MEQTNTVMAMFQTMTAQGMASKAGKKKSRAIDGFQELLEQKSRSTAQSDAPVEKESEAGAVSGQKGGNSLDRVRKLAEQGYDILQPPLGRLTLDGQFYGPGEYVAAWKGTSVEVIPITDLDEFQTEQLKQLLAHVVNEAGASYPKPGAMAEAALVKAGDVYSAR